MRTVAIIQARMGSTRFPGKVLADLGGKPVLAWVVEAAKKVPMIDEVWVAVPDNPEDDRLMEWVNRNGSVFGYRHYGSENDVLQRYLDCAVESKADVIVRLTGDCPLLDPFVIAQVMLMRKHMHADYASNVNPPTFPDGLDCECFTRQALERCANEASISSDREHVTPYMRRNKQLFKSVNLTNPAGDQSQTKWSIDTPEDLERVREKILQIA